MDRKAKPSPYLLFVLILSLFAIALITFETLFAIDSETQRIIQYADLLVCSLFFIDFIITLRGAQNKRRYMLQWGWLDFLSCVPTIDLLRWGRAGRVFRIFRILRIIRSVKALASFILTRRAQSAVLAAALISIILVVTTSIAVLHFEQNAEGANIKSAEDAVWWALVTITTVGYGDRYPVTTEGRIVATLLMIAGVGLFGTLSGLMAAWFMSAPKPHDDK